MIIRPTASRLLDSVREELATTIAPLVDDAEAQGRLAMIDSILASVSVRVQNEVAWLREEIADAEAAGRAVIDAGADTDGKVATALTALAGGRAAGDDLEQIHDEYDLAGEVLSCAIEAALPVGGDLRTQVEDVLGRRIEREVEIRGEFALAGRA